MGQPARPDSIEPRREHDRFSVELEVSVLSEHNLYAGLAENLSAGGLFIATHKLQKVGSKIELSLRMPGSEEEFPIVGEVRWVRLYNEQSDTSPGLGVRFLELPAGAAAAIERFLAQREPLFFDDE
ncbi:MAG: TIGR02266 family protein [Myxococcales bacterium]